MTYTKLTILSGVAFTALALSAVPSFAGTAWQSSHPRRVEVNNRLGNQSGRINQDVRGGSLSRSQAHQLRGEDGRIHQEERDMASQDHGHLTRTDQRALNRQETGVNRQLAQDTSHFNSTHPRRAEVNGRLQSQDQRINQEYHAGDFSQSQAQQLHHEDNQVAQEERDMASQSNGHISHNDQVALNQQQSAINQQIKQDR